MAEAVNLERLGSKTEVVRSCAHAVHPIIGFVVQDEQGWMALPTRASVEPTKNDSRHDAIDYIRRSAA